MSKFAAFYMFSERDSVICSNCARNAKYIKKDGLYIQMRTWDYPQKVILLDSTNSTYELNSLDFPS